MCLKLVDSFKYEAVIAIEKSDFPLCTCLSMKFSPSKPCRTLDMLFLLKKLVNSLYTSKLWAISSLLAF